MSTTTINVRPSGMPFAIVARVRIGTLLICLLGVTGCDEKSSLGPTVPLNERFTLSPGEVAVVAGADLRIQFLGVTGDSRCPADAVCIQGGDAVVSLVVSDGLSPVQLELHTGDAARASAAYGDVRIALVDLQPYPFSSRTIDDDEYRATLTVGAR